MKVLQLGKAYPPVNLGGVEVTIKLITEGLYKLGVHCDVLGVNNTYTSKSEIKDFGIIYREALVIKAFSTLFSFKLIYRLFRIQNKYDIIHVHHPDPMSAFALWICRPSCKLVIHWHSDIIKQKKLLYLFRPFQTWMLRRCNAIICTTQPYAENSLDLKKYLSKVKIIPIGIDNQKLIVDQKLINQIKNTYNNKKIILSIGRMSYYKGYEFLIEATKYFDKDIILIIIGEGELKSHLQNKVIKENLLDKIIFLGKSDDIVRNSYLSACDIFVLSSIYKSEAFAIVQIEAMAFGKPIVSTKIPKSGVDWVNQNMVSGLTVPICDPLSIANSVNKIINNNDLKNELSKGAISRFHNNFTQEIMSKNINILYNKIL